MRLLALTRYSALGASSRLRLYQFIDGLEHADIRVDVKPLFNDKYLQKLYASGRRSPVSVACAYLKRVGQLIAARGKYDVVWVEKELFPYMPLWVEKLFLGKKYVIDLDDAIFHNYDSGIRAKLFGGKIAGLMKGARCVLAGSPYLANYAVRAGARDVHILPTVVDVDRIEKAKPENDKLVATWIGTDVTAKYLCEIESVLSEFVTQGGTLRLIGATRNPLICDAELVPWDETTEYAEIAKADIGIMPLPDQPWERGKCGYKLIQYMASGLPVLASPVGVNMDIVESGINGFLCENTSDWQAGFEKLADKELRQRMGEKGRDKVIAKYSLCQNLKRLKEILEEV